MTLKLRKDNAGLDKILDPSQTLQIEAQGFTFIEGGVWNKQKKSLISVSYTHLINNRRVGKAFCTPVVFLYKKQKILIEKYFIKN